MRRQYYLLIFILLFSFVSCSKYSDGEYKIGVVVGLSGKYGTLGSQLRDGIALAFDEMDYSLENKFIKLIIKDDKQDKNVNKKIVEQFLKDNIKIIIGNATSSMTKETLEIIKDHSDILLFSPTASSGILNDKDDNLIRLNGSFDTKSITSFIVKRGWKNITLIGDSKNKAYLYNYSVLLKKKLNQQGIKYEKFIDSNENVEKILAKLKTTSSDAVILLASSLDALKIIQYLRIHGVNISIISSAWAMSNSFLQNIGKYTNNLYFIVEENKKHHQANYLRFEKEFMKVYKKKPTRFNYDGYVVAKILIQSIKEIGSFDAKKVKKHILSHKFIVGDIKYHFTKFGDLKEKKAIFIIDDNQFVRLKKL